MRILASEMRALARKELNGNWTEAVMLTFVYFLISAVFSATVVGAGNLLYSGIGNIATILLLPMGWGFACSFLALHRGEADPFNIKCLISGYRDFSRIFLTVLLEQIYTMLWLMLLVIPGIIKALSYSMTIFILRDNPEIKNNDAIELSMAMMKGHKMELFILYLSFIGWGLLCILTFGIGLLWLEPYMMQSLANFYEKVKTGYSDAVIE